MALKGSICVLQSLCIDDLSFIILISKLYMTACHVVIRTQATTSPFMNKELLLIGMLTSVLTGDNWGLRFDPSFVEHE